MKRASRWIVALALCCPAAAVAADTGDDALPIIQRAFEAAKENEALARQYVYHERLEERRFNRKGKEKKREAKTWDVTLLDTSEHRRLIAIDDRPLDAGAEAKEQKKLDKQIRKTQAETPRQREQRLARHEKEVERGERFLEQITRAFDFRVIGEETIGGVATWVISAEPKAGYRPTNRMTRVLPKVRATLWVSREDDAWVQADIEMTDDITWLAIYKMRRGTQVHFEQRRLENGPWVTDNWTARIRARLALVHRVDAEISGAYSNFRRFSTDTTVTGWTEVD